MDPERKDEDDACVSSQMEKQASCAPWSLSVRPFDHSVERSFLDHAPRYPKAGTEHHKHVCKVDKDPTRLVFVHVGLLKPSMHAKKRDKVVQIRIVVERIGMAVVCEGVLMLPQDRVAQERHSPYRQVVDPRSSTGGEMPRIVTQRTNQPAKDGHQKAAKDASLAKQRKRLEIVENRPKQRKKEPNEQETLQSQRKKLTRQCARPLATTAAKTTE